MQANRRRSLIALSVMALIPAEVVFAETGAEKVQQGAVPMDEIVVTATKEGEVNLQKVPSAITAVTSEDIESRGVQNIEDLVYQVPGLTLTRNNTATRLYIRGIGSNLDFVGSDPSVTVHIDGVYMARPTTVLNEFLDIERVEVLRGPQGTLYGRNSIGGSINIISKLPTNEAKGKASIAVGNYNYTSAMASISGPLVENSLMGSFAVMKTDHDPYIDNTNDEGVDGLYDDDSLSARGTLRWLVGNDSELIFRTDFTDIDRLPGAYKATGRADDEAGSPVANAGLIDQPSDPFKINVSDVDPFVEITNTGGSVEFSTLLNSDLELVSLTGYRKLDFETAEDTDGSALDRLRTHVDEEQEQFSEALRLIYSGDGLKVVSGLFFLQEEHDSALDINVTPVAWTNTNETDSYALFGNATFSLTEKLNVGAGLRYSYEEKTFTKVFPLLSVDYKEEDDWDAWSPKLSIDYTADNGALVYSSVSRGFKSGGYNLSANADAKFDPEYVVSYEIGVKTQWDEIGLRTNIAVFYYDYEDLQVSSFVDVGVLTINNAAEASVEGIEIENRWMPNDNWAFDLNFAFLDARYDKHVIADTVTGDPLDVSGNHLNASPRRKLNLAAQYFHSLDSGMISYRVEYGWQTKQFFTDYNYDVSSQSSYGIANARIAFQSVDEKWEAHLYAENIGDKAYSTSSREFPVVHGGVTRDIGAPRTIGAKLVHHFM